MGQDYSNHNLLYDSPMGRGGNLKGHGDFHDQGSFTKDNRRRDA